MNMTRRQAIAEVRSEANAIIEQLERIDRGWDQGPWRNDMREIDRRFGNTIEATLRERSEYAFALSTLFPGE